MVDAIVHSGLIAEVARSEDLNSTVVIGTQPGPFQE